MSKGIYCHWDTFIVLESDFMFIFSAFILVKLCFCLFFSIWKVNTSLNIPKAQHVDHNAYTVYIFIAKVKVNSQATDKINFLNAM